jgi:aminoglycoside/choline kinase family phosphotransferase
MQWNIDKALTELFESWQNQKPDSISPLPPSGSNRRYFRITYGDKSCIGAFNPDIRENLAFLTLSRHFDGLGLPVPKVLATDVDGLCYLLTDLGDTTLFSLLPHDPAVKTFNSQTMDLYKKSIDWLPAFQVKAAKGLDFSICYPRHAFDRHSMMWDLNYFKYYFLKISGISFDEQKLEDDFEHFSEHLLNVPSDYFLYRDFQSRNIMIADSEPFFIDYQGGRRGALQYDVASLLFDAKANIPFGQRVELLDHYIQSLKRWIEVDEERFRSFFFDFVLMRILQALGTYGFRGGVEKKALFLQSVPYALKNLHWLAENDYLPKITPHLSALVEKIASTAPSQILPAPETGLNVHIRSFSYKNGIPPDEWGNGGGFVFDCRALPNPGRYPEYKELSGKDSKVIHFLKKEESVSEFLENARNLTDFAVKNYLERGFNNLMISFGCTGGQHRSVYFAETIASHLAEKFTVKVDLKHREEHNWPKH